MHGAEYHTMCLHKHTWACTYVPHTYLGAIDPQTEKSRQASQVPRLSVSVSVTHMFPDAQYHPRGTDYIGTPLYLVPSVLLGRGPRPWSVAHTRCGPTYLPTIVGTQSTINQSAERDIASRLLGAASRPPCYPIQSLRMHRDLPMRSVPSVSLLAGMLEPASHDSDGRR